MTGLLANSRRNISLFYCTTTKPSKERTSEAVGRKVQPRKIQYRIFPPALLSVCVYLASLTVTRAQVRFRFARQHRPRMRTKIWPKSAMNGTTHKRGARRRGDCERELTERKGNTAKASWRARESPIAIGYGFYFYRLSKIPSTRVGELSHACPAYCVFTLTSLNVAVCAITSSCVCLTLLALGRAIFPVNWPVNIATQWSPSFDSFQRVEYEKKKNKADWQRPEPNPSGFCFCLLLVVFFSK